MKRKKPVPVPPPVRIVQITHDIAVNPACLVSIYQNRGSTEVRMNNGVTYTIYNTTVANIVEKLS